MLFSWRDITWRYSAKRNVIKTTHVHKATVSKVFFSEQLGDYCNFWNRPCKKVVFLDHIKSEMRSFKSNENIHMKEGGSYYVVSANKASSVTL